jgi:hypothetical protein
MFAQRKVLVVSEADRRRRLCDCTGLTDIGDKCYWDQDVKVYDKVAANPNVHKVMRNLMAQSDAEDGDEDAAIARGDLVLHDNGRLLPAGDPALVPGYTPPRPPTVAFSVAVTSPIKKLAVSSDGLRIVGIDRT